MTKVPDLPEVDVVSDEDFFYIYDTSMPLSPDRKVPGSKMRPAGARISRYLRYEGNIALPALAAGAEAAATISLAGALPGDNVIFNLAALNPGNIAIIGVAVTASDVVSVMFRNTHASAAYAGAALPCMALVIRSSA